MHDDKQIERFAELTRETINTFVVKVVGASQEIDMNPAVALVYAVGAALCETGILEPEEFIKTVNGWGY